MLEMWSVLDSCHNWVLEYAICFQGHGPSLEKQSNFSEYGTYTEDGKGENI